MLSIIIPMFNEEKTIFGLLESIFVTLDVSQIDYEIVVVNDASRDNSRFQVEKLQRKELKLIDLATNSGKGHAVQVGIENSIGDIIVVLRI
jgi:glycosyltransferase involved in cell wall biosynthesis